MVQTHPCTLFHCRRYAAKKLKNALSKYLLFKSRSRVSPLSQIPPGKGEEVSKNKMPAFNPPAQSYSPSSRRLSRSDIRVVAPVRRRSSQRLTALTTELSGNRQPWRSTPNKVNLLPMAGEQPPSGEPPSGEQPPSATRETEIGEGSEPMKSPKPPEKARITTLDGDLNDSCSRENCPNGL